MRVHKAFIQARHSRRHQSSIALWTGVVLLLFGLESVGAAGPSAIEVRPNNNAQPALPFNIVVTDIQPPERGIWRVEVYGSRSAGTTISPGLQFKSSDRFLAVGLPISETKKAGDQGRVQWRTDVTVNLQTAKDCDIELYIQPEGVAYDGGQRYRIPLAPWIERAVNAKVDGNQQTGQQPPTTRRNH